MAPASFAEESSEEDEVMYDDDDEDAYSLIEANSSTEGGNCDLAPFNFGNRFKDLKLVGSGMRGCVYLAKDSDHGDREVAIKVSKGRKELEWECTKALNLHKDACKKGKEAVQLAENYLPTCLESKGKYMLMHSVHGQSMGKTSKISPAVLSLPTATKASIFAQIVGALTAIHGSGWTHNDLHFGNIMLLEGSPERIAIIDFGATRPINTPQRKGGYHVDGTLLGRAGKALSGCKHGALLPCLMNTWGADEEFLKALGKVIDNSQNRAMWPKLMSDLYHTEFVQKHQPPLKSLFQSGQCN